MANIHEKALEIAVKQAGFCNMGQAYVLAAYMIDLPWMQTMEETIDNPRFNDNVLHYFLAHWQEDHPEG